MITWVNGSGIREAEGVARDGEVTHSLWILLEDFASFKGASVFVVMLTMQLKSDSRKKIELQRKKFHDNIQPTENVTSQQKYIQKSCALDKANAEFRYKSNLAEFLQYPY